MPKGTVVTYKDLALQISGYIGLVEGPVDDEPGCVWVRWNGNCSASKELAENLTEL